MLTDQMARPTFWLAALQIMGINILLSGDNAVVIALAVRGLPPKERSGAWFWRGRRGVLLIVFTGVVATLMELPYLKLASGLALFWVAVSSSRRSRMMRKTPRKRSKVCGARYVVVVANIVASLTM